MKPQNTRNTQKNNYLFLSAFSVYSVVKRNLGSFVVANRKV